MKKLQYTLLIFITLFILTGCPNSEDKTIFYLAGEITTSSQSVKTVFLTFYNNTTVLTANSKGQVTDISGFSRCGDLIRINVLLSDTYLVKIPPPYEYIGGFIGWIDENGNNLPDPDFEEVFLPIKNMENSDYPVTAIKYSPTDNNFIITLMTSEGTTDYFLTLAGNNGFNFSF